MTPDQARAVVDVLTQTIEHEGPGTRKMIAAIPGDLRHYRPDPKSRSAWELALHMVTSDVWFADSILGGGFEWSGEPATPPGLTDPGALAAWHEKEMTPRIAKLRGMSPEQMLRPIDFFGSVAPACTWLTMMNNHAIHHRGQLAAYLHAAGTTPPTIYA
jgi:uncharacterized damage-inducible protein DinB